MRCTVNHANAIIALRCSQLVAAGKNSGNNAPLADIRPVFHLQIWRTPQKLAHSEPFRDPICLICSSAVFLIVEQIDVRYLLLADSLFRSLSGSPHSSANWKYFFT